MKLILASLLCFAAINSAQGQHPRKFDEYGTILLVDEKARLDNLAIHLKEEPTYVAWVVAYAGQKACVGEARARASRAKNHLVISRGIQADRVMWVDGGFRREATVELWAYPRSIGPPSVLSTVDKGDVQILKKCKRQRLRT